MAFVEEITPRISGLSSRNGTNSAHADSLPQPLDRRILVAPGGVELDKRVLGVGFVDGGVDRPQILGHGIPAPPRGPNVLGSGAAHRSG